MKDASEKRKINIYTCHARDDESRTYYIQLIKEQGGKVLKTTEDTIDWTDEL